MKPKKIYKDKDGFRNLSKPADDNKRFNRKFEGHRIDKIAAPEAVTGERLTKKMKVSGVRRYTAMRVVERIQDRERSGELGCMCRPACETFLDHVLNRAMRNDRVLQVVLNKLLPNLATVDMEHMVSKEGAPMIILSAAKGMGGGKPELTMPTVGPVVNRLPANGN